MAMAAGAGGLVAAETHPPTRTPANAALASTATNRFQCMTDLVFLLNEGPGRAWQVRAAPAARDRTRRPAARSSLAPGMVRQASLGAVTVDEGQQVGVDGVVVAGVKAVPGAGVDGEAGCGEEFGGLSAGEVDGR